MVENDVCMVNKRTDLFAKRFRSKPFSAFSLPSGQMVGSKDRFQFSDDGLL